MQKPLATVTLAPSTSFIHEQLETISRINTTAASKKNRNHRALAKASPRELHLSFRVRFGKEEVLRGHLITNTTEHVGQVRHRIENNAGDYITNATEHVGGQYTLDKGAMCLTAPLECGEV